MIWPIMQTPNRAALSIVGLYEWDDRILDGIQLPAGVNPDEVKQNILMECAELTVLYPDWDFMYKAINWWSRKELPTWEHVYEMTQLQYNPIENYDRYENEAEQENASETHQRASQTARSNDRESVLNAAGTSQSEALSTNLGQSGTENSVAGFNSNDLATQSGSATKTTATDKNKAGSYAQNTQKVTDAGTDNETQNEINNGDQLRDRTRSSRIHGNVGVTTVAQMMAGELETYPKINIVSYIVQAFKERFCIMVY